MRRVFSYTQYWGVMGVEPKTTDLQINIHFHWVRPRLHKLINFKKVK